VVQAFDGQIHDRKLNDLQQCGAQRDTFQRLEDQSFRLTRVASYCQPAWSKSQQRPHHPHEQLDGSRQTAT